MTLMDEIDANGNVVKSNIVLGMYDKLPFGHQWVPHTPTLQEAQTTMITQIELWRDAACQADVSTTVGGTVYPWQADKRSQELLNSVLAMASNGIPCPTVWRSSNNINVAVTQADLVGIAAAMAASTQAAYARSWVLKAQALQQGATIDSVNAITW